ncbi:MAG TPA: FHA domain-containing protein [Acidimicrobiales bacterium]|nr:FHA domain-containing protein [Acidimicrobiales bacterium]
MPEVFCNQCGHANPQHANFCSSCGQTMASRGEDHTQSQSVPISDDPGNDHDVAVALDELESGQGLLVVRRGPGSGSRFALDRDVVSVGRHPQSDIFLDDVTVSRRHAEVVRVPEGYEVRDVGSLNGTYLNRERIESAPMSNGDELQVGRFKLVFLAAGDPPPSDEA